MWLDLSAALFPWLILLLIFLCFVCHLVKNWLLNNNNSGKSPDEEGIDMDLEKDTNTVIASICEVSANVGWASLSAMLGSIPKSAPSFIQYH